MIPVGSSPSDPVATRPTQAGSYVPEIDGLRLLAISVVMVWHAALRASRFWPDGDPSSSFIRYLPHGEVGVVLFFVISGAILTRQVSRRNPTSWPAREFASFYMKRCIRILPPYYVVVLSSYLIVSLGFRPDNAPTFSGSDAGFTGSLMATLAMIHGVIYQTPPRMLPPGWSLEVEIQFYILFPFLWLGVSMLTSLRTRVAVLLAATVLLLVVAIAVSFDVPRFRFSVLNYGHVFLCGMLIAQAQESRMFERIPSVMFDIGFLFGCGMLVVAGQMRPPDMDAFVSTGHLGQDAIREVLMFAGAILTFLGGVQGRWVRRALSLRYVALLGGICFSLYLVHVPTMHLTAMLISRLQGVLAPVTSWGSVMACMILVSFAVGIAFFAVVERTFLRLASAVGRHADPRMASGHAAGRAAARP